jgi:hypothetical protein
MGVVHAVWLPDELELLLDDDELELLEEEELDEELEALPPLELLLELLDELAPKKPDDELPLTAPPLLVELPPLLPPGELLDPQPVSHRLRNNKPPSRGWRVHLVKEQFIEGIATQLNLGFSLACCRSNSRT